jgi:hypothetical protein
VRIGGGDLSPGRAAAGVVESLAVGSCGRRQRIVLFVPGRGQVLDQALRERIATRIRTQTTPRHARIVRSGHSPTKSGRTRGTLRMSLAGDQREALANPEALDLFRIAELRQ